jgi:hypothetical protein
VVTLLLLLHTKDLMVEIVMVLRQVVEAVLLLLAQTGLVITAGLAVRDRLQLLQGLQ